MEPLLVRKGGSYLFHLPSGGEKGFPLREQGARTRESIALDVAAGCGRKAEAAAAFDWTWHSNIGHIQFIIPVSLGYGIDFISSIIKMNSILS